MEPYYLLNILTYLVLIPNLKKITFLLIKISLLCYQYYPRWLQLKTTTIVCPVKRNIYAALAIGGAIKIRSGGRIELLCN